MNSGPLMTTALLELPPLYPLDEARLPPQGTRTPESPPPLLALLLALPPPALLLALLSTGAAAAKAARAPITATVICILSLVG